MKPNRSRRQEPDRPIQTATAPFDHESEQLPEQGDEQERAVREWLRHVKQGRIAVEF